MSIANYRPIISSPSQNNNWQGLGYNAATEILVACATNGTNRVMSSANNGQAWTNRSASQANPWNSCVWFNTGSVFVACATTGTNRIMTSPTGVTWTNRSASQANPWESLAVSDSLGQIAACATTGTNRIMTSINGTAWTNRTIANNTWRRIIWGRSEFIVFPNNAGTANIGRSNAVATWTTHTTPIVLVNGVYSPDLLLYVAYGSGSISQIYTNDQPSTNSWTARTLPEAVTPTDITYDPLNQQFLIFTPDRILISENGINWVYNDVDFSITNRLITDVQWQPSVRWFTAITENSDNNTVITIKAVLDYFYTELFTWNETFNAQTFQTISIVETFTWTENFSASSDLISAYKSRVEAASGTLNNLAETALRNFVTSIGIIATKLDYLWMPACDAIGQVNIPIIGPNGTNTGLTVYNKNAGLSGNRVNYLDTNFTIPPARQNNLAIGCYVKTIADSSGYFGTRNNGYPGSASLVYNLGSSTNLIVGINDEFTYPTVTPPTTSYSLSASRTGVNAYKIFFNNDTGISYTNGGLIPSTFPVAIFGIRENATTVGDLGAGTLGAVWFASALSDAEVATLHSAMATFQAARSGFGGNQVTATVSSPITLETNAIARQPIISTVTAPLTLGFTATANQPTISTVSSPLILGFTSLAIQPVIASVTAPLILGFTSASGQSAIATVSAPLILGFTGVARQTVISTVSAPIILGFTSTAVQQRIGSVTAPLILGFNSVARQPFQANLSAPVILGFNSGARQPIVATVSSSLFLEFTGLARQPVAAVLSTQIILDLTANGLQLFANQNANLKQQLVFNISSTPLKITVNDTRLIIED